MAKQNYLEKITYCLISQKLYLVLVEFLVLHRVNKIKILLYPLYLQNLEIIIKKSSFKT